MASSKKTLDIDTFTFQTMYIKAQAGSEISSYTIPMIPGSDTVLKKLIYLTPEQALSVGNIYITQSTIPEIVSSIVYLSTTQGNITYAASSVSTLVSNYILETNSTTASYVSSIYETVYNSSYSTLAGEYAIVVDQNISTLFLQDIVLDLGASISTLSSQYISSFEKLDYELNVTFNQGPAVSSLSTYFTEYFSSLAEEIPIFSTSICGSISTTVSQDASTVSSYFAQASNVIREGAGPGVSSMSTLIGSTFTIYEALLPTYNPAAGMSSISTNVVSTLGYFSTQFILNSGIPGICSLSTAINQENIVNISTLTNIAGVPGLCSMSTYLTRQIIDLSVLITTTNNNTTVSSFSTAIYNTVNTINTQIYTVGYTNTILQQDLVKTSISTLSTSFGYNYINMTSLSSFSSMLPSVYSTLSSVYSLVAPYSTIAAISTNQGSNMSTILYTISSTYPAINCGSGVSSLSIFMGLSFSSLSTSLDSVYQGFSNTISSTVSSFTSTTINLIDSFSSVSSILSQNLVSPLFSTFSARSITVSSMMVDTLTLSSLTVNGSATILPKQPPQVNYVMVGPSIYTGSNAQTGFTNTGLNQFTDQGNDIAWNGSLWVTVGNDINNGNFIKYSSNPSAGWSNATIASLVAKSVKKVKWIGSSWIAGGSDSSGGLILSSSDASTWLKANVAQETRVPSSITSIAWNGFTLAATGVSPLVSSIVYRDSNGIWNNGVNTFTIGGSDITNNGHTWVAVGNGINSIKYSYDAKIWSDGSGQLLSTATVVVWNGDKFVAGGSSGNNGLNTIYSFNGATWTYSSPLPSLSPITSLLWDGSLWSATCLDGSHLLSSDAVTWNSASNLSIPIYGQAYASNTIPTLQLSNIDIYSQETPANFNSRTRINVIQSSIFFNDGDFTIRHVPSSIAYTCVGINNTYPTVALDIGYGDARKPSGSQWLNASDARVKTDIRSADLASCAKLVSEIPLRTYSFIEKFQKKTGISPAIQYGFIAQEVKKVLPNSIRYSEEFGFSDFHCLDTDQIFKAEFGATQYLIGKLNEMEAQISTLEYLKINSIKKA